ncbi:hypothetical protein HYU16_03755 [Candidatus Woesearchaeota archaeon]|nr:hypothetical protein [Candidatus Woesearchaeota archaeon]
MKKGARKSGFSLLNKQIRKEIDLMHKATAEFVDVCIDVAKAHPRGFGRIKGNVERIAGNMMKLDKLYAESRR